MPSKTAKKKCSTSNTQKNLDLVDETILQQVIKDTSVEVIPLLIECYLRESYSCLEKIHEAFHRKNIAMLQFETHNLSASALALGNRQLSEMAKKIELFCLNKQLDKAFESEFEFQLLARRSIQSLADRKKLGFETPSSSKI
ncbi:Hpt domain-containing protein [Candidatus Photodesmus blepharus]|uniref:Hpt domain-containing protein n=1 Tax=Candidatus Photodesmus blepharonis TaxID=1179155 RepID=UPI0005524D4E|nr:Hpt domain-containing protein [Candidatus Photodesmus blepharus]